MILETQKLFFFKNNTNCGFFDLKKTAHMRTNLQKCLKDWMKEKKLVAAQHIGLLENFFAFSVG